MGGCVISLLSTRNAYSTEPHQEIQAARRHGVRSVEIGTAVAGASESRVRRAPESANMSLEDMYAKYYGGSHKCLPALLKTKVDQFAFRKAIAYRPIDRIEKTEIVDNGKTKAWEYIHLKPNQYLTFTQLWDKIVFFGAGMRELGFSAGARIGLYEETRWEWLVSAYGSWTQSMTVATVYANLGEDALEYAIKEAELDVIVCNGKAVKNILRLAKASGFKVPTLVYLDQLPSDAAVGDAKCIAWNDVVAKGVESTYPVNLPTNVDDLALIMYTSGTTGDPKGVMLTHGNVVACVLGFSEVLAGYVGDTPKDDECYVAFLPLAHILEFAAENVLLLRGSMLGFGSARTLTSTSARPHGDLEEFKPILMAGVPRIFDTIKKAVEAKLPPGFKRQVFERAYHERKDALEKGMTTPYWDAKVFAAPRALLGGKCIAVISGGAPLSAKTQEFMQVVFGCSVGQGYGLTETSANGAIQGLWENQPECLGGLVPSIECKLLDVEDWKHTNANPQGEICFRGPSVTKGYFKQPEKTKEAFPNDDGWFHTGDVGQFMPDGVIKIVGRVKALAKNAFGEYVALDALESIYNGNEIAVANGVCVLVDSSKAYISALVLTDEAKAMAFAKKSGIAGTWPAILENPDFQTKAAASLAGTAKAAGKKPFELVKYVRVLNEEWTPENGVLTAASKLKRRIIDLKYADLIKELFQAE